MIREDEALEISRKQSKLAKEERLAKQQSMLRPFTESEEKMMREGFIDIEEKE